VDASPAAQQLSGAAYLRVILMAALIGIPAALVAALFLALVHEIEGWLWDDLPDALGSSSPPWYLVIGLPVVGAAIVVLARRLLPGDGGHSPLNGLNASPTPLSYGPGVALAALGTLCFGAVLGPEAPLIALGSVVGLMVTLFLRLGPQENALVATAGSFSAVSALFGGPLVAGVLLLEASVGLGAMAVPALLPGLVAAAVGFLIFVGLGDWGGLGTVDISVPDLPAYDGVHVPDLILAVLVGIASAVVMEVVRRIGRLADGARGGRVSMPVLLLAGGLAVGVIAQVGDLLGANSQDILFSGQDAVPAELAETSAWILLVLLVGKALGYAISLGCGFRGGPVFPAVFIGVALASFGCVWFDLNQTLALAVGAAAGMAAMTRLLFASLLLSALLAGTQGADTVPAAVFAAATAWVVTVGISRRSQAPAPTPGETSPTPH
jgi:H+/Cl- antiporter ClcA